MGSFDQFDVGSPQDVVISLLQHDAHRVLVAPFQSEFEAGVGADLAATALMILNRILLNWAPGLTPGLTPVDQRLGKILQRFPRVRPVVAIR